MLERPIWRRLARKEARNRLPRPTHSETIAPSTPVPLDWLRQLTSEEAYFREALGTLFDSSLVKESKDRHGISIHPLVHRWLRERLDSDERLFKSVEAVFLVSQAVEVNLEGFKGQIIPMRVDIHIESCVGLLEHLISLPMFECEYDLCQSMIRLAGVLMEQQKSEMLFKESLRRIERHPETLHTLKHSAVHCRAKRLEAEGLKDEAENLYSDLLQEETAEFGEEDPRSMSTLHCLATIYARGGRAAEAKPMLRKVLHFREQREGKLSRRTLCVLNNLSFACLEQGQFPEARDLLMSALERVERSPELATFLTAIHVNAARMYEQSGEVERAGVCLRAAVAEATKRFGSRHPLAIGAIESCSLLASKRGMHKEAIELECKLLESKTPTLGHSHRSTVETLRRLAQLYWQEGDTTKAELHFKQLLQIRVKEYGEEDPRTLETMNSLGLVYWDCGYLNAAVEQFRKVLTAQKKSINKDTSSILLTENNLGVALKDAGKLDESAKILENCTERAKSTCGSDSIEYLVLLDSLGRLYQVQRNPRASKAMFQESLLGKEKVLGRRHPLTLSTMHNLAMLCAEQGDGIEAQRLFKEAFSGKALTFGLESPYTLKTAYNIQGSNSRITGPDGYHKRGGQLENDDQ
jgi:tetratricopeptide (TPR) repeat protein